MRTFYYAKMENIITFRWTISKVSYASDLLLCTIFFLRRARVRGKCSNHIKNEREASEIPRTVHLLYTRYIYISIESVYINGIYRSADARFENSISLNEIRFRERRPRCLYKWHRTNVNSRDRGIYINVYVCVCVSVDDILWDDVYIQECTFVCLPTGVWSFFSLFRLLWLRLCARSRCAIPAKLETPSIIHLISKKITHTWIRSGMNRKHHRREFWIFFQFYYAHFGWIVILDLSVYFSCENKNAKHCKYIFILNINEHVQ